MSQQPNAVSALPYYQAHATWDDDYDDGEYGQGAFFASTESQAIIYAFIAAFMGWVVRGCTNIKWYKIGKKVAEFMCSESLVQENRKLHKELKEYKDLLKTIVNNPEARNEANGIFVASRSGNRSGRDNPTLSSSSNFQQPPIRSTAPFGKRT